MTESNESVVWIASYPKSGNTWLRFLVCNLVFGPIESAATLNQLAPDLHELTELPPLSGQRMLFKTHYPFSAELPLAQNTAGAIYIIRNPADVMLSNFFYAKRSGGLPDNRTESIDTYFDRFLAARGDPRWTKLGMGTWEENVRSWIGVRGKFPVLYLRYEDLLSDSRKCALRLCQFLGLSRTSEEIARAVEGATFERMRAIEESDIRERKVGIFYKPYLHDQIGEGARFMRSGRSGEAPALLTADQRLRFDSVFGGTARELGYRALANSVPISG